MAETCMQDIAPLAETTPEDIKNFCATQACAQPDDVVTLARATLETLSTLWQVTAIIIVVIIIILPCALSLTWLLVPIGRIRRVRLHPWQKPCLVCPSQHLLY